MSQDAVARLHQVWRERGGDPFLIDAIEGRSWTYGAFVGQVRALADHLSSAGLRRGDRLAIVLASSPELAALYFACLHLGLVAMPVNPALSARDLDAILCGSRPTAVACSRSTEALLPVALRARVPSIRLHEEGGADGWRLVEGGPTPSSAFEDVVAEATLSVHFTSGTTSVPKGVAHRAGSLLQAALTFGRHVGIDPECRFHHVLPMSYMAGFLNLLLCPFMAGGSVVVDGAWTPQRLLTFWQAPMRHGVTALWLVPTMMAALLKVDRATAAPAFCRESVRLLCVGTAPLPEVVQEAFLARYGLRSLESYGLSETLFLTSNRPDAPHRSGSVGTALEGVELSIRDDAGEALAAGVDGEVWARTPWDLVGYLDYETGAAQERAPGTWFPTGDLGHVDADGWLFITGRKKDLIIRGGTNVSPRAVEEALLRHAAIADAAVVGVPHPVLGEEVVAVVVLRPGAPAKDPLADVLRWCRDELAVAAVPSRFLTVDALPTSSTGKVMKATLREWAATRSSPS